jgi:uncharacterized membrane protein
MTTPVVMLVLLTAPYLVARVLSAVKGRDYYLRSAAAIGLGILFTFTGIGHFTQTEPMAHMLPPWVPGRVPLIYASGILEFAIATGFMLGKFRRLTGWIAAAFLVAVVPSNIYAAMNYVPMGGHAWGLVWLRLGARRGNRCEHPRES